MKQSDIDHVRSGFVRKSDNSVVNEADGLNPDGSRNVKSVASSDPAVINPAAPATIEQILKGILTQQVRSVQYEALTGANEIVLAGASKGFSTLAGALSKMKDLTLFVESTQSFGVTAYYYNPVNGKLVNNGETIFTGQAATTSNRPLYKNLTGAVSDRLQIWFSNGGAVDATISLHLAYRPY